MTRVPLRKPSTLILLLLLLASGCDSEEVPSTSAVDTTSGSVSSVATTTSTLAPTTTTTVPSTTTTEARYDRPDLIDKLFAAIEETLAAESGKIQIIREIVVARSGGVLIVDGEFQSESPGVALHIRVDGELVEVAAALFGSKVQLSEELARNPVVAVLVDEDSAFVETSATSSSRRPWKRVEVEQGDQILRELGIAVPLDAMEAPHFPLLEVLRSDALVDIGASPLRTVRESRAEGIVAHIDPHAIVREVVSDDLWKRLVDAGIDEMDIGPPIEVGVWVTNGHIGAVRIDLTDLFAQIGAIDVAPSLMEQLSQSVRMRLSIEIWDVDVPNVIEYPPPDQVATP